MQKIRKGLYLRSSVKTLSIKCYEEQIPKGWNEVKKRIKRQDKNKLQVLAIYHDKCIIGDNFWTSSEEKPHYHIIVRVVKRGKDNKVTPYKVETILKNLGIEYRKEDKILWENHGVETISNFANMAMYLTHDTEQAELDGKTKYDINKIVSNLDIEEIKQIREGYTRPSEQNRKVSNAEMVELDKIAEEKGYNLESYEDWIQTLDFATRSSSKMKTVKETYWYHANRRIEESKDMLRLCVFIQGEHNVGKTYNAAKALQELGYRTFNVDNKDNSGKFDNLKMEHTAMVVDDAIIENLLSMSDNRICQVYRRNKNNPFWCGNVLIITSNKDFDTWARSCGIDCQENLEAAKSRFYICRVVKDNNNDRISLICDEPSRRGTMENQQKRFELYEDFRDKMNEGLAEYMKMQNEEIKENIYKRINCNKQIPQRKLKLDGVKRRKLITSLQDGDIAIQTPKQNTVLTFSLKEEIEQKEKA